MFVFIAWFARVLLPSCTPPQAELKIPNNNIVPTSNTFIPLSSILIVAGDRSKESNLCYLADPLDRAAARFEFALQGTRAIDADAARFEFHLGAAGRHSEINSASAAVSF